MITFLVLSTLIFASLTFVWRTNDRLNLALKMLFFMMTFFGMYETLKTALQQ